MKINRRLIIVIPVIFLMVTLAGCTFGKGRYELTNYIGKSVSTFQRRTGAKLTEQSNDVYAKENVVQVMAPNKKINSVTLLKNADKLTVFGVKIGMNRKDIEEKLRNQFGNEISKTVKTDNNSVTYTYRKEDKELYVSYDTGKDTVVELSYFKLKQSDKDQAEAAKEPANTGELIAMIGNDRVYYNEAMVYLKSAQDKYEKEYGKNIWKADILGDGQDFGTLIKDEVIRQITELKIIRDKAKELKISLSEEETADAHNYAKQHYEGLTEKDIKKYLVTQELLNQIYEDNLLADKVFENLTINVDTNVSDEEAKQITVQDIFVKSGDTDINGTIIPLSDDEKKAAYEKIKDLLKKAKDTKDFKSLAQTNSEADTVEYTFGKNQGPSEYGKTFEDAAFQLKTGQISDIITTDNGWHILYCVSDFNEDATTQIKESIIEQRRNEMFEKLYSEWSKDYNIVVNSEVWKAIPFEN